VTTGEFGDDSGVPGTRSVPTVIHMDDETRWTLVAQRQQPPVPFLYAVRTTGVYCRPTCSSRRPRPENVVFFDDAATARASGYRACLRCRPDVPSGPGPVEAVVAACRAMLAEGGPLPVAGLERAAGLPGRRLGAAFREVAGCTPRAFGDAVRTGAARTLLRDGRVADAVFAAGFGSVRGFYETAAPTLGMTPSTYAAGAVGERLRWATTTTPVGELLAVAADRGLCAVRIGPDAAVLLHEVREEFPAADLIPAPDELAPLLSALAALAAGHGTGEELPVDLRGTAFQARVWAALRRIPAGATRTYAEVAADIGAPTAVRAVAGACAANRVALAVPCHRVVRTGGALGGYRWGVAVKQSLLDAERASTADHEATG
jgi:AraC family transcriptional regulator of adaptative response/methylated-DNA-[protein]-cysteine methyltransferase